MVCKNILSTLNLELFSQCKRNCYMSTKYSPRPTSSPHLYTEQLHCLQTNFAQVSIGNDASTAQSRHAALSPAFYKRFLAGDRHYSPFDHTMPTCSLPDGTECRIHQWKQGTNYEFRTKYVCQNLKFHHSRWKMLLEHVYQRRVLIIFKDCVVFVLVLLCAAQRLLWRSDDHVLHEREQTALWNREGRD